ncbi:hypothetical protein [Mycobacterium colombiense]|nr:hypothetical protein [Mycobacterium colombiense]
MTVSDEFDQVDAILSRLRGRTQTWRSAVAAANDERAQVNKLLCDARQAGASFREMRDATGLGVGTIQMVLAKAGIS